MGHEHEGTIKELLTRISRRGTVRTKVVDGKVVDGAALVGKTVRVHLHKVRAHTGVSGNEVADEFAKHACRSPEDPQVQIAPGKVVVERDFSFWVTPTGGPGWIWGTLREQSGNIDKGYYIRRRR
jgi:hypothetical protein